MRRIGLISLAFIAGLALVALATETGRRAIYRHLVRAAPSSAGPSASLRPAPAPPLAAPTNATVAVVFGNTPLADLVGPQPKDLSARAFVDGMRQVGWVDGQNLTIVWRSAEGHPD